MNEKRAVEGHRQAIREHIEKYERYTLDHEKQFALKTIRNAQKQIADIQRRNHIPEEWEDTWSP